MLTITETDIEPGAIVELDGQEREVKRLVRHPAGAVVQWKGDGDYASTHNSFDYLRAAGATVTRRP